MCWGGGTGLEVGLWVGVGRGNSLSHSSEAKSSILVILFILQSIRNLAVVITGLPNVRLLHKSSTSGKRVSDSVVTCLAETLTFSVWRRSTCTGQTVPGYGRPGGPSSLLSASWKRKPYSSKITRWVWLRRGLASLVHVTSKCGWG